MNKKQKTEKCREILYKYGINEVVNIDDEIQFLLSIFENHNEWIQKKGCGIKSISIMKSKFNRCFQINRIDGTSTDISFVVSITNLSKIQEIKNACRTAIKGIIIDFKNENVVFGKSVCPITGDVLIPENTNIDHYDLTFDEMFKKWLKPDFMEVVWSLVEKTKDNSTETKFIDEYVIEDFINFHNKNCKLRAVSKKANLSLLRIK